MTSLRSASTWDPRWLPVLKVDSCLRVSQGTVTGSWHNKFLGGRLYTNRAAPTGDTRCTGLHCQSCTTPPHHPAHYSRDGRAWWQVSLIHFFVCIYLLSSHQPRRRVWMVPTKSLNPEKIIFPHYLDKHRILKCFVLENSDPYLEAKSGKWNSPQALKKGSTDDYQFSAVCCWGPSAYQ